MREVGEGVSEGSPPAALGVPIVATEVGANPDLGAAGGTVPDRVVGELEHGRQVARGVDRAVVDRVK